MEYFEYNQTKYSIINEEKRTARTGYGNNQSAISYYTGTDLIIPSTVETNNLHLLDGKLPKK